MSEVHEAAAPAVVDARAPEKGRRHARILLMSALCILSGLAEGQVEPKLRVLSPDRGSIGSAHSWPAHNSAIAWGPMPRLSELSSDDWPGFRGLSREGRAGLSLPTHWDSNHNVSWKTAVRGRGYSSPIVAGDHLYVTTAYATTSGQALEYGLRLLLLALLAWVMSLAARTAILRLAGGRRSDPWSFIGAYAMISAVVALAIIAIAGEALFDFARCDIRGWLGSSFFATLCLTIAVTGLEPRILRIVTAALALGFTVLIVAAVPSPEHAYLGGIRGMNAKVMMRPDYCPRP
jgi:hypothetical protein